jgi:argininosuccinate lyase
MESDRPQHDCFATCVIAQQYSSSTFVSLCFHSLKEKQGAPFRKCFKIVGNFVKILSRKLRNLGEGTVSAFRRYTLEKLAKYSS